MATRKNKKVFNLKIAIIVVALFLILMLLILLSRPKQDPTSPEAIAEATQKYEEERKQEVAKDLYNKSEQERMQYYCGNFFKLVDSKNYEKAYELLYGEYKENYFPTFNNFKRYIEEFFPSDFAVNYENIERLGDIYVMMVNIRDTVNGSYGKNFDMYVVLQEESLNNYVLSFSRNSAVGEGE